MIVSAGGSLLLCLAGLTDTRLSRSRPYQVPDDTSGLTGSAIQMPSVRSDPKKLRRSPSPAGFTPPRARHLLKLEGKTLAPRRGDARPATFRQEECSHESSRF